MNESLQLELDEEPTLELIFVPTEQMDETRDVIERCILAQLWQVEGLSSEQQKQIQEAARAASNNAITAIVGFGKEG